MNNHLIFRESAFETNSSSCHALTFNVGKITPNMHIKDVPCLNIFEDGDFDKHNLYSYRLQVTMPYSKYCFNHMEDRTVMGRFKALMFMIDDKKFLTTLEILRDYSAINEIEFFVGDKEESILVQLSPSDELSLDHANIQDCLTDVLTNDFLDNFTQLVEWLTQYFSLDGLSLDEINYYAIKLFLFSDVFSYLVYYDNNSFDISNSDVVKNFPQWKISYEQIMNAARNFEQYFKNEFPEWAQETISDRLLLEMVQDTTDSYTTVLFLPVWDFDYDMNKEIQSSAYATAIYNYMTEQYETWLQNDDEDSPCWFNQFLCDGKQILVKKHTMG